jgi:hypothetical protein
MVGLFLRNHCPIGRNDGASCFASLRCWSPTSIPLMRQQKRNTSRKISANTSQQDAHEFKCAISALVNSAICRGCSGSNGSDQIRRDATKMHGGHGASLAIVLRIFTPHALALSRPSLVRAHTSMRSTSSSVTSSDHRAASCVSRHSSPFARRVCAFRAGDLRAPSVCPCHIPEASATIGVIDKTNSLDAECLASVVRLRGRASGLSRLPN